MSRADMIDRRADRYADDAARVTDGFVATPADLAEEIVSAHPGIGTLPRGGRVLEPSAGRGALVRWVLDYDCDAIVTAVEPSQRLAADLDKLAAEYPGRVEVQRCTFEEYAAANPGEKFDAVVMNPPFSGRDGADLWADHTRRAWDMTVTGGHVVAIVPASYTGRGGRVGQLRDLATANGARFEELEPGAFRASRAAGVRTGVLTWPQPMPARPSGRPAWVLEVPAGRAVTVPLWDLSARGAVATPVQRREREAAVLRYVGVCWWCSAVLWQHDRDGGSAVWEANHVEAAGTSELALLCLNCRHTREHVDGARAALVMWEQTRPAAGPPPVVYAGTRDVQPPLFE